MVNKVNKAQVQAQELLDNLVKSVRTLLDDITALEVNTMVVDQITGAKFNAWKTYQEIYSINDKDYFDIKKIPDNLHGRYKSLFEQLEREYFYILLDSYLDQDSEFYNPQDDRIRRYQERLEYLKANQGKIVETDEKYVELAEPILPAPSPVLDKRDKSSQVSDETKKNHQENWVKNCAEIRKLFNNDEFLRSLRKIAELKAALDSGDVESTKIDIIYAQTVMQLDGDIISRYHKQLFEEDEETKDLIIQIHKEGVIAGEKQWRGTLDFLISLVKGIANIAR
ncbi:hypothetical protein FNW02_19875 [Komarekiella sp. 'clone 1']|uniref:Uncharacterized protein n=1 Tax=Komarekiella delphini-convector SJRDD-AB1 TaxID=2593771 RepID=A0AA40SZ93_9NOST|nr:hypothetical protein [Komarekiella delphini-convector]MBD6618021.1 hypothetical protein [Komarekiella delphini-convector SJRDD-AB1]